MRIGLISDTHGRLRRQVFDLFDGVDSILHAGDIGGYDLLVELEAIAPVHAVYGNTDGFDVRPHVKERVELERLGARLAMVHGHQLGAPKPDGLRELLPDADIIVYGHTHRPLVDRGNGALVVNPGSAGAARFGLAPSVAILEISEEAEPDVRILELD